MSIGSILNMARQGMNAQQMAVNVASQNIANAQAAGYSKQRIDLEASLPTVYPYGSVGTGVDIAGITRARDTLLDAAYRTDSAKASGADTTATALSQIQDVFGEPSDSGLNAALDAFWSSWSDLSSDPTNSSAKSAVIGAGQTLVSTLNRFASQIATIDQNNREGINADVNQTNQLTQQIADLNRRIVSAQSTGQPANDLLDQRDKLLDQVTQIVGGQVVQHTNGSVAVYANGRMIVDDTTVKQLAVTDGVPPTITYAGSSAPIDGIGGSLGARLAVSGTSIPSVTSKLDAIAKGLVQSVNAIHSGATTFSGSPPVAGTARNFFDVTNPPPAGGDIRLTALGIRLSPTITGPDDVAASAAGATGPGNNDVAAALAALTDKPLTFTSSSGTSTTTMGDFFSQTVGDLATSVKSAQDEQTVQSTLASNADNRRSAVSGVSTDEELISVIDHQHAYQAAARLVNVAEDMLQTLVDLGR